MSKHQQIIVTGIGTDIGKTVVSAILAQALKAFYWKPLQAGELENSDTMKVNAWTDQNVTVLPEAFRLESAMSPHAAAAIDGVEISQEALRLPEINGNLVVEGAGGILVPVNHSGLLLVDLFEDWNLPIVVVSRHYVGSINHTLLTLDFLKNKGFKILGIVFVGDENLPSETFICSTTGLEMLARIPLTDKVDTSFIQSQAKRISIEKFVFTEN
jgi:dethiobiotin synthetase